MHEAAASSSGTGHATPETGPFAHNNTLAFAYPSKISHPWSVRAAAPWTPVQQLTTVGMEWNEYGVSFPPGWDFSSPLMDDKVRLFLESGSEAQAASERIIIGQRSRRIMPPVSAFRGPAHLRPLLRELDAKGFATFGPGLGGFADVLLRGRIREKVAAAFKQQFPGDAMFTTAIAGATTIPYIDGVEPIVERLIDTLGHVVLHYVGEDVELSGFAAYRLGALVQTPATHAQPAKVKHGVTSALWHHDRCGKRLKVYVYLHQVTSLTHPTEIAAGSHRTLYYSYGDYYESRFDAKAIRTRYNTTQMLGEVGGGFIFDTNAIHRGLPGASQLRDVLIFEFNTISNLAEFSRAPFAKTMGLCSATARQTQTNFSLDRIRYHHRGRGRDS